jgi:signal transduction histidine kinase
VLVNLLRNAHEACHGHDQVEVEVGGLPQPYVKIKDTGCGINEEFLLSNLFVPFSTTKENGMGIGLYQSKHIIEAHNGRLEVESSPGHGSTFTILLPELRTA